MASTTPQSATPTTTQRRPSSQTRHPASRPTTPLRPPSRNSLRASTSTGPYPAGALPLETLEAQFAELSDSLSDLQDNFQYLGLMHESIGRFSENFASFLYGMNMNAFCVDFPEAPIPPSFLRPPPTALSSSHSHLSRPPAPSDADPEATFLTTDTSFVENPPSSRVHNKFQTPTPAPNKVGRGGIPRAGGAAGRGARGSGIARGASRGASGIGRGTRGRGRGA